MGSQLILVDKSPDIQELQSREDILPLEQVEPDLLVTGAVEHDKVVTYRDRGGLPGYLRHCYRKDCVVPFAPASPSLKRPDRYRARWSMGNTERLSARRCQRKLRRVVKQVLVHLDGLGSASSCFQVLHDERGLSAHFLIDNDGTIYQTLALMERALHGGMVNEISVGIELQNRGNAARHGTFYDDGKHGPQRAKVYCEIHGVKILAYDFTEPQYRAMIALSQALHKHLDVPLRCPEKGGDLVYSLIDDPRRFEGFLGHYHIEAQKWDPGPFDFRRLFRAVGAKVIFPLPVLNARTGQPLLAEKVPPKEEAFRFTMEEERHHELSEGTPVSRPQFPVGPMGVSRLWHGGLHLKGSREGQPIFAPLLGQIVAARISPKSCGVGSCNFLLMRHQLVSNKGNRSFFTLFFHLQPEEWELSGKRWLPWVRRNETSEDPRPWVDALKAGQTTLLRETVQAGEVIGHVGEAGPLRLRSPQIHFAVFSGEAIHLEVGKPFWEPVGSCDATRRVCDDRTVLGLIDRPAGGKPRDGKLSRRELANFFGRDSRREQVRRLVACHLSEWTNRPSNWLQELQSTGAFAGRSHQELVALFDEQVEPTLWWTPEVGRWAGLPDSGVVYSYHPITFLRWYRGLPDQLKQAPRAVTGTLSAAELDRLSKVSLTVDGESSEGMVAGADEMLGDSAKQYKLEDLANGYDQ